MNRRTKCGTWVELRASASRLGSRRSRPRHSIGAPAIRWLMTRRSTITSASAKPASTSPPGSDHSWTLLVPSSSCTNGAARDRRLGIDDRRQRLVLDEHVLGRVGDGVAILADHDRDRVADVLDLPAGQRPVRRVVDLDAGRRPGHRQRTTEIGHVLAGEDRVDARAARAAAEVSIEVILAWASGERTNDAHSIAGQRDVVDVAALAGDQRADPPCAAARGRRGRVGAGASRRSCRHPRADLSAASSTALTMLW